MDRDSVQLAQKETHPHIVKAIEQSQVAPRGLTSADAERLLSEHAPNEMTPARRAANVIQLLRLFANPRRAW